MACDHPLVTVVIPAYNAGAYLRDSVESILAQSYAHLQILVVDDGSTDGSIEALSDIDDSRVQILRQKNSGKSRALNAAIAKMCGEFIAIQDADDTSYPNRIEQLVECMRDNPDVAMIFSGHDLIVEGKRCAPTFGALTRDECRQCIERFQMPGHDPTAFIRADVAREFQFDPELRVGQGFDFILRVGEKHPLLRLGRCLYSYRVSEGSATRGNIERRIGFVRTVLRRAHERRGIPIPLSLQSSRDHDACKDLPTSAFDNNLAAIFMESVIDLKGAGRLMYAFTTGVACARRHPWVFHYWKALIYSLMPMALVRCVRARRG